MASSVLELPGVRVGARVYVYTGDDDEGTATRIEDLKADLVTIVAPDFGSAGTLGIGEVVELEVLLPNGSLFMVGPVCGQRVDRVRLFTVRVEEVGADPEVGASREVRRHYRQSLQLPARRVAFRRAADGEWHEVSAIVRDISSGGLSLFADDEIPVGATVVLDCPVPLAAHRLGAHGTVVGSRHTGSGLGARYVTNVRFEELARREVTWLTGQLNRYQWLTRWRNR